MNIIVLHFVVIDKGENLTFMRENSTLILEKIDIKTASFDHRTHPDCDKYSNATSEYFKNTKPYVLSSVIQI